MTLETMLYELRASREFFLRSTSCLTDEHSGFRPVPGQMSVTEQMTHAAQTINWFVDGMVSPTGFDMDFEGHAAIGAQTKLLSEARAWFVRDYESAIAKVEALGTAGLDQLVANANIMSGRPRWEALVGLIEHTAHHRGALTVYSRLLGLTPKMPYMD